MKKKTQGEKRIFMTKNLCHNRSSAKCRVFSDLLGCITSIWINSKDVDYAEVVRDVYLACLHGVGQLQSRLQQQTEQLRQELESAHTKSSQQLHSRLSELEASCKELTERKYKNESVIRDLKLKLVGAEEVSE